MVNKMKYCLEYGYISLNKKNEELCGDKVEIIQNKNATTLVLADGLGSGVKANILSTLTSKILCTMISNDIEIEECIDSAIRSMNYSRINVFYNHYYSLTSFEFLKIQLFPVEFKGEYYEGEDFVAETDLNGILSSLMTFYICYQLKMCESISYAAENVLRTQITSSALDKLEEKEEEDRHEEMKRKKEKSILRSVENFKKIA